MNLFRLSPLLLVLFGVSCSSKVTVKDNIKTEQVDLKDVNPLALFYAQEDSIKVESFTGYNFEPKRNYKQKNELETDPVVYYVQVGFSDNYEEIHNLRKQIQSFFPDEQSEIKYIPPYYRIFIGPIHSKSEANKIFSILESKKFPSLKIITEKTN